MLHSPRLSLLLGLAFVACSSSSDRRFTDDACYSDATPPPWATLAEIALFDQDGQPVCANAHVTAQQGGRGWFDVPRGVNARSVLLPNGHFGTVPGEPCNYYQGQPPGGPTSVPLLYCSDPLEWRVAAEGCEPAQGSWSWNDNTFPGRFGINFQVTVRLRCFGARDGGTSPGDAARD